MTERIGPVAAEYAKFLQKRMAESGETIYGEAVNTEVLRKLQSGQLKPFIADACIIVDNPEKLLKEVSPEQQIVANEMREVLRAAKKDVQISTPYFIPRDRGIDLVREMRGKGIRVLIFTNSLATNNHTAVHSAYAGYRKYLLEAGVELWEARADAAAVTNEDGETELDQLTLHTKGMLIDREQVFVGSLNLDPRSIDINTEMGLLINSPDLAGSIADRFEGMVADMAYRVSLDDDGDLIWTAMIDGQEVVETKEPQTSGWDRFNAWFLKIAPERQL
jgi:putative cardiolipin synthase